MTGEEADYFYTIDKAVRGTEQRIKGSRFIPAILPVTSKQEIEAALAQIRKEFHDATHHCYAYRLGASGALLRAADDGEPSGTAGRPILLMLTTSNLTNTLLIVTRYFGGTMLGTGGLARAYADSAKGVIAQAQIKRVLLTDLIRLSISYEDLSLVERLLAEFETKVGEAIYGESVMLKVNIRKSLHNKFVASVTEALNGRVKLSLDSEEKPASE